MNQKNNKIAICFLAIAILASIAYMFLNIVHNSDFPIAVEEKEPERFIAMTPEQIQAEDIKIRQAQPGQIQYKIYAPGKIVIQSNQLMHVVPKVSGIVKEIRKNVGDAVIRGEILALLDSQEMAEAKLNYLDKLKKERQAQAILEREIKLREKNISSEQDLQSRQLDKDQIQLEHELAKQKLFSLDLTPRDVDQLEQTKIPLRQYELRSPLTGTIIDKKIIRGAYLQTEDEIYVIANLNVMTAELSVSPYDMEYVAEGQEIEMTCPYGNRCQGKIISVSPIINEENRTIPVIAIVDNSTKTWKPGTFVSSTIKSQSENTLLAVPKEAIQKIDNEDCVFVLNENGFEIRSVKRGRSDEEYVEILSGLLPNESYASTHTFILKAEHGKDEAQHMD